MDAWCAVRIEAISVIFVEFVVSQRFKPRMRSAAGWMSTDEND